MFRSGPAHDQLSPASGMIVIRVVMAEMGVVVAVDLALRDRRRSLAEQRQRRIPPGAVALVAALPGDRRQCLQHDPVGQRRGDVGVIVRRADLDHVHPDHRQLEAQPAYRVQQLPGRQSAGLRGSGARRMTRVADVDVDGQEDTLALVGRDRRGVGQTGIEPAVHHLGHLEAAHVLLGHPLQGLRWRPVAAQPDLQEPVAPQRAGLDQPTHRLPVPPERTELDVTGVGMGVEVDHRHPAVAEHVRAALGVGIGDRVITAEDDRDRTGSGGLLDGGLQRRQGHLDVAGVHLDVPGVIDVQVQQTVGPQRQRRPGPVMREVVGHPDRLRSEPGAGPIGRTAVERSADDHHIGVGVGIRFVEIAAAGRRER